MCKHFDVVVVGAGIFGSCAAHHCQKLGLRTLLLEQFAFGHKNGSSHGKSRIIRYAHTDAPYVPLVHDAYQQIDELERKRDEKLWRKTGLLWVGPDETITGMSSILKDSSINHDVISGNEVSSRYPQFKYNDSVSALIDPMGGVLFADKWLNAFQDEFRSAGGVIHHEEEVVKFTDGKPVEIVTNKDTYTANKAIVTVGSWISKLIPSLPLKVQPLSIHVTYFKAKKPEESHLTEFDNFPVFIGSQFPGHFSVYALPAVDYPQLVKFCSHEGPHLAAGADHGETEQKFIDIPSKYINEFVPAIDPVAQKVDKCKYTMAQDHHYVIDKAPNCENIIVGGCGSGSGFKVAPGIGRALAEMAAEKKTTVDVSFFSLNRFL